VPQRPVALPIAIAAAVLLLWLAGFGGVSGEQNVNPGINAHYQDAQYEHWVRVFERPGREVFDRRRDILAATGLMPGMKVADIGAGTGLFSLLFAREVGPAGRVYAVDVSANFVDHILARARRQGLTHIEGRVNSQQDAPLEPGSLDLAFLCDTYHHFEYPRTMLAAIRRGLKPDGEMVVVDFERVPGLSSSWVLGHVRAGKQEVISEIEAAGFALVEDRSGMLTENYFLRFRRQADAAR
jgi:ubiquinone/menaquinone biosynthesis C-methylase UbiE